LAFAFGALFEAPVLDKDGTPPVLFPDITYSFYPVYAELWGLLVQTIPLGEDFSINTGAYKIPAGGVIFPNPNAPTGRALSPGEIKPLLEYQGEYHRVVVIDEAYAAFGAESMVPYIDEYPNLLTVHTLSKSASLAGLRTGFAIGNEELIEGLCRIRDSFNSYTMDRLALAGAAAAIRDVAYYEAVNARVVATRERASAALRDLGFTVIPSQANFVFARPPRMGGAEFFTRLRERGILTRHFNKPRISDFLRISIGTDEEMDELVKQCREILG
jgi:histidinol-phosphate aminotransferase